MAHSTDRARRSGTADGRARPRSARRFPRPTVEAISAAARVVTLIWRPR